MAIYKDAEEVLAKEILVPREPGVDPQMVLIFPVAPEVNVNPPPVEEAGKMPKVYALRYEIWNASCFGWLYRFSGIVEV